MFDDNFRVCFADTPFGVALHQRIRYQVFCLDKGFENPDTFSTNRETDAWDAHSAHFIVQDRSTRQWVAATRLVLPRKESVLPVQKTVSLDPKATEGLGDYVGEISRFCIISARSAILKQGDASAETGVEPLPNSLEEWGIGAVTSRQQFELTLGMIRAVVIYALKRGMEHCYVLITDAFARMLRKIGVKLIQIGPTVDYRGMRTPFLIEMRDSVLSMSAHSSAARQLFKRSRHAYVRISSVAAQDEVDTVSEFSPDHSLFNETLFRETVLLPAEDDSSLRKPNAAGNDSAVPVRKNV
jgi:N-acyl amino acid synthase of PEP-CTERM/exosortase system